MPRLRATARLLAVLATAAVTAGLLGAPAAPPAQAARAASSWPSDTFVADQPYSGTFADPTVLVDGATYVASATTTANINLPVMTSSDLVTWRPTSPIPDAKALSGWRLYNEPMLAPPPWAAVKRLRGSVPLVSQWAPSLVSLQGQYVAAFSAATRLSPRTSCIGLATAPTATGPFTPTSASPLVCFAKAPAGAIDPDFFVDPRTGTPYLLWKNERVDRRLGPKIVARRLTAAGTAFVPGTVPAKLVTATQRWEAGVVENPSMVYAAGRYHLLYSGNDWRSKAYATGSATCAGPLGPCTKMVGTPILRSGSGLAGPGGADAFVDLQGRLRFAYAAFDAGRFGDAYPRRMHIGTLATTASGARLVVTAL